MKKFFYMLFRNKVFRRAIAFSYAKKQRLIDNTYLRVYNNLKFKSKIKGSTGLTDQEFETFRFLSKYFSPFFKINKKYKGKFTTTKK